MYVCTAWLPGKLAKQQPTAWNDHKPAALHRHAAPSEIAKKGTNAGPAERTYPPLPSQHKFLLTMGQEP